MNSSDKYRRLQEALTEKAKLLQHKTLTTSEQAWLNYAQSLSKKGYLTGDEVVILNRTFP
jgi:hypothetical protein